MIKSKKCKPFLQFFINQKKAIVEIAFFIKQVSGLFPKT
jgi:hypothetical protein